MFDVGVQTYGQSSILVHKPFYLIVFIDVSYRCSEHFATLQQKKKIKNNSTNLKSSQISKNLWLRFEMKNIPRHAKFLSRPFCLHFEKRNAWRLVLNFYFLVYLQRAVKLLHLLVLQWWPPNNHYSTKISTANCRWNKIC